MIYCGTGCQVTTGDRYDVSGLVEAQFEPGSGGRVLRNRLGIRTRRKMDEVEAKALQKAVDALVRKYDERHRFTAGDMRAMHKRWLGAVYDWAGEYRLVNISKGGFPFAAAALVPSLMTRFERDVLARHTPCRSQSRQDVIRALAHVHVELVLIHPFREGNGRIVRVLSKGRRWRRHCRGSTPACTAGSAFRRVRRI